MDELEIVLDGLSRERSQTRGIGLYDCSGIASRYCGLKNANLSVPGKWQHGWSSEYARLTAECEFGESGLNMQDRLWVARTDHESFLKAKGFASTRAIGLPCVYIPRSETQRISNSLLVVPAHSLDYTTHCWKFDEYAAQIHAIRDKFDYVAAIVHKSCLEKGYWVKQFEQHGIKVYAGAHANDPSSLYRIEKLFSTFEYVTTNTVGSHVAYASFWGSKVSFYGTFAQIGTEDFANCPFFQSFPHLLAPTVKVMSEEITRENLLEFFVDHPKHAKQRIEWGEFEVGADNRLSPREMKKAFGWTLARRNASQAYTFAASTAKKWLPEQAKRGVESWLFPDLRRKYQLQDELQRVKQLKPDASGCTDVLGQRFEYLQALDFAHCLEQAFERHALKFSTNASRQQTIIDVNPGVGVSTLYFSLHYPLGKIIAVEPNIELRETLVSNLRRFEANNVEVLKLIEREPSAAMPSDSTSAGSLECGSGDIQPADLHLRSLLNGEIDMLRISLQGESIGQLFAIADLLANVKNVFIEYRSAFGKRQRLKEIITFLADAGFRTHITNPIPAERPLVVRPVQFGFDMLLEIFAFRDCSDNGGSAS